MIAEARNEAAHPGTADLSWDYTLARLDDIADILGEINAPDEKRQVETIRGKLTASQGEIHRANTTNSPGGTANIRNRSE